MSCATASAPSCPEFRDSEFTWKDFQDKNNNELVAILGNFVQRVFVLCQKFYGGRPPIRPPVRLRSRTSRLVER